MNRKTAASLSAIALALPLGFAASAAGATPRGELIPIAGARTVTFAGGSVWVTTTRRLLVRIDPATNTVVARIRLPGVPSSAAVAGRHVWVVTRPIAESPASSAPSSLTSVDMATNRVAGKPIPLFPMAQGQIAAAGGSLWITNDNHGRFGRLFRVDPKSRKLVGALRIPDDPSSVVVARGLLWVGQSDTGTVVRVDPATGRIEGDPIAVGHALLTLAADGGRLWALSAYSGRLVTIDATSARIIGDRPLPGVSAIAASRGTVWTASFAKGEVRAFAAAAGSAAHAPVRPRGGVDGIAAGGGGVWAFGAIGITRIAA